MTDPLPATLALNPRYRCHLKPPDIVLLLGETDQVALEGPLYVSLLGLVEGGRTLAGLHEALSGTFGGLAVAVAVRRLLAGGYLCDAEALSGSSAFWSTLGIAPGGLASRRQASAVHLAVLGGAEAEALALGAALAALGVPSAPGEGTAALSVLVSRDVVDDDHAVINRERLRTRRPWMPVRLAGTTAWLGPVFGPEGRPCWACLAHRVRANRPAFEFLAGPGASAPEPPAPSLDISIRAAADLAALRIGRWLWQPEDVDDDVLVTIDLAGPTTTRHPVVRRPQCPACGTAAPRSTGPLDLRSRRKLYTSDGGFRTVTAEATEDRLARHLSPLTGIVTRLDPYDLQSPLLNVYRADHRLFGHAGSLASLRESLRNMTAGKGRTRLQARVSAMCEAIERHSGRFDGSEVRHLARLEDLGERAIHPADHLLFSDRQYATRDAWNPRHSGFAWVPDRFDADRAVHWTSLRSLRTGETRFLPSALCFYDHPPEPGPAFGLADSNGTASGNTLEEAILQGFLELVERDAVAVWWYNRLRRPALDLDEARDPLLDAVREEYQARNRELWAVDLTGDLGIPVFAVVSRREDRHEEIIQGYGCHLDPRIALSRAVTECTQMLAHVNVDGLEADGDPDLDDWFGRATVGSEPYLLPDPSVPARSLSDHDRFQSGDLRDDVQHCIDVASKAGLDMLVLDQTRPDVDFPVVKVVVPGLRHFWARLAPGRLYDVPVRMGWRPDPLAEADLNPRPICS